MVALNPATALWLMAQGAPEWPTTLEELVGRPAWMADAACSGMGHARFIVSGAELVPPFVRRLCEGCQVRKECLAFAIADSDLEGIWGGTTYLERRTLRGQRLPARPRSRKELDTTGFI